MRRERVDKVLVERGLAESRVKAQALVMAGVVLVDEQRAAKPSDLVSPDAKIRIKYAEDAASRYVGRGGLKLDAALQQFQIDVSGLYCLDVGASTGGFTDCLLQRGARHVVALDVGHNQIHWRLRQDIRVEVREGVNARYLNPADFPEKFDLAVMDVSFISATKVMPAIVPLLADRGHLVVLIKPQFEVGKGEVGQGGVVRDPDQHAKVIEIVNLSAQELGLLKRGLMESPIRGAEGNVEFLAWYAKGSATLNE